ncbi:MAG: VWA domain-containing protein, partial [Sulfitobacter sp.]|nr:VWA domain-containing protein [Sulfitobacter sp.]
VDSTENRQARDFVSQLGLAFELGTANDESHIGISTWARNNDYELYDFPVSTGTYTTSRADVLSYANSARTFGGGTDVRKALQKAAGWLVEDPVVGRTAPKVIVLMTDAYCYQVSPGISPLATQLKDAGVYIVVMAVGAAGLCDELKGDDSQNVASPGGYFSSPDPSGYQSLQDGALTFINSIQNAACDGAQTPEANLTVSLSGFELSG